MATVDAPLLLAEAARGTRDGTVSPEELLAALLRSTVFCEAPETPGVMTAETEDGPVVPVYTSLVELAAARGAVPWFSTTGLDLLGLLPHGHDLALDPAGPTPLVLRTAALRPAVHVS